MSTKPLIAHFQDDFISLLEKYDEQGLTNSEVFGGIFLTLMEFWWYKRNADVKEMVKEALNEQNNK